MIFCTINIKLKFGRDYSLENGAHTRWFTKRNLQNHNPRTEDPRSHISCTQDQELVKEFWDCIQGARERYSSLELQLQESMGPPKLGLAWH